MSPATDINYELLFSTMIIKDDWKGRIISVAEQIKDHETDYDIICSKVNEKMPWYFPGIIHYMECGLNFNKHLHNGNSLLHRTIDVPAGRPIADPVHGFPAGYTFIESAVDALVMMKFDKEEHWSLKDMLFRFEEYNGFGYEKYHNMYSPYIWSATNHYDKGKYDKDGHWAAKITSEQVGAAPLLRYLTDKTLNIFTTLN
jgi:lysozyme family protein